MPRGTRASLVVWIDERRVGAASIAPGEPPSVLRATDLPVPSELLGWMDDLEKATQLGRSLKAAMRDASFHAPSGRAVGVVSRQCVVLKRLRFEGEVDQERDLPGMVRLQLVKQLALPLEGAAIDFALHPGTAEGANRGVSVIAAAMIGQRAAAIRSMAKTAGLKLARLGVSPSGLAALAGPTLADAEGPVLAIVPTVSGADYLIVDRGRLSFARMIEITSPYADTTSSATDPGDSQEPRALPIELLATEAKRTWVSERLAGSAEPVSAAMVLVPHWVEPGDRQKLTERCAGELGIPCTSAALGDLVSIDERGVVEPAASWLFAAAGVAQGAHLNLEAIDLLRQRKPPDPRAKMRQAAMAAAFVAVAAAGITYTMLSAQLRDLEIEKEQINTRLSPMNQRIEPTMQTQVVLHHLQRWDSTGADWLGHVDKVTATLPARESFVLSDLTLTGEVFVAYGSGRGRQASYDPAMWRTGVSLQGTVVGRAASTDIADAWRGRLVSDALYSVSPVGRDMPGSGDQRYPVPVAVRLFSGVAVPVADAPPETETDETPGGEAVDGGGS